MKIPRIVSKVYSEPWAILPDVHRSIRAAVESKLRGESPALPVSDMGEMDDEDDLPEVPNCAVIPVHGIIGKHLDMMESMCGGCDLDDVCRAIDEAGSDDSVDLVMFDFRSPGGTVTGVQEAASEIADLAKVKPVCAFTDSQCCSAAYWMASQCPTIFTTPSAIIGSVGVICVMFDQSRMLANAGIEPNEFRSGDLKGTGAWYRQMTDEEKSLMQARVDRIGTQFRSVITAARQVKDEDMRGQVFDGMQAVEKGFADEIVGDIEDAIELAMS